MGKDFVNLTSLSREELEARIHQLGAQNVQLRNIIKNQENGSKNSKNNNQKKVAKEFDFSKHSKRHVLLKIAYLGWDRQGYVVQDDTSNTVEAQLFDALRFTRLIEARETSNYHRCGRTDKGVSSFCQVISITVRSRLRLDHVDRTKDESSVDQLEKELNYPQILNRVLPADIRVLGWSPAPEGFSARFDCISRTYKYFFPRGNLDLELMNKAAQLLVGEHDFRNFCKMDVGNGVVAFKRKILSIVIKENDLEEKSSFSNSKNGYQICIATIEGVGFLWHQIRSIMTVLFLVGEGKEDPSIVEKLLDTKAMERKPQYGFASEVGLNLYNGQYENIKWRYDKFNLTTVISQLQSTWAELAIKSSMLHHMLHDLGECLQNGFSDAKVPANHSSFCLKDSNTKVYKPLLERETCESLEERVKHFVKRRRLDPLVLKKIEDEKLASEKDEND